MRDDADGRALTRSATGGTPAYVVSRDIGAEANTTALRAASTSFREEPRAASGTARRRGRQVPLYGGRLGGAAPYERQRLAEVGAGTRLVAAAPAGEAAVVVGFDIGRCPAEGFR